MKPWTMKRVNVPTRTVSLGSIVRIDQASREELACRRSNYELTKLENTLKILRQE